MNGDPTEAFITGLKSYGIPAKPVHTYSTHNIFHGASISVFKSPSRDHTIGILKTHPDVKNVWPVRLLKLHQSPQEHSLIDNFIDNTFSPVGSSNTALLDSYQNNFILDNTAVAIANSTTANSTGFQYPPWDPHKVTGVSELHARGITGKGVTVGIVDSGAYYLDKPLGGGIGSEYKVLGGYNFVGDVYDQSFQGYDTFPPNDNVTDCYGHGTHTAGIIAASNNTNFIGVAPDANLRVYKVFGCVGTSSDDSIMNGLLRAFQDNNDILSLSLGVDGVMFTDNPLAEIATRINDAGTFVAISAANSGNFGPFFGNGLAAGNHLTSVAASVSGQYLVYEALATSSSGETFQFAYSTASGIQPKTIGTFRLQLYNQTACGLNGQLSNNTNGDPIALLFPQGSCKNNEFYYSVSTLGYPAVFTFNNNSTLTSTSTYPDPSRGQYDPISIRGSIIGQFPSWAQQQILAGNTVDLTFEESSLIPRSLFSLDSTDLLQVSRYTSMGPNFNGALFPQITAPGSNIYSTFLFNEFATMTGTSMAAPYIAGVAALYLSSLKNQTKNTNTAINLHRRMIQTATPLQFALDSSSPNTYAAPLIQQGFGFINATRFLDTKSLITSDPNLSLGISSNLNTQFNMTLYNGNNYTVQYSIEHNPAITVFTKRPDDMIPSYFPPFIQKFASVSGALKTATILPMSSQVINFGIKAPDTVPAEYGPVYQGKILFTGDNGEKVSAAYVGTYVDSYKAWSHTHQPLFLFNAISNATILDSSVKRPPVINNGLDSLIYLPLFIGASKIDIALVNESFSLNDIVLPVSEGQNGVVNFVDGFPYLYSPRSLSGSFYLFEITASIPIPNGEYRALVNVLPAVPNDNSINDNNLTAWQTFISEPFFFIYSPNDTTVGQARGGPHRGRDDRGRKSVKYENNDDPFMLKDLHPRQNPNLLDQTDTTSNNETFNATIFTGVELTSLNANYSMGYSPYDTIQITIQLNIEQSLVVGQQASIKIAPEFHDFSQLFPVYNDLGQVIMQVTIDPDTNILTVTVTQNWDVIYITGSIVFTAFLKNPEQFTSDQLVPVTFVKELIHEGSVLMLDMAIVDVYFLSIQARVVNSSGVIYIYVPPTFKGWANMQIGVTSEYTFQCSGIAVEQTQVLENQQSQYTFFSEASVDCASNFALINITNPPADNRAIRISIPVMTPATVVNSAVNAAIKCDLAGSLFTYYLDTVLNNVALISNSMSLTGKRN